MVQKSTPGLDFGSASVWLLARKRNDDLAVQYEDCPWIILSKSKVMCAYISFEIFSETCLKPSLSSQ